MKNDIKTIDDLLRYKVTNEMQQEKIETRQKELYRQNSVKKRACNTMEDIRQYQIWNMDVQSELDSLKQEKREIKKNLKLVDECLMEKLYTASFEITDMEEQISNTVDLPEYSYGKNERVWEDSSKGAAVDEAYISDMAEIAENSRDSESSRNFESPKISENTVATKVKCADIQEGVVPYVSAGKLYEKNLYEESLYSMEVSVDSTDVYEDGRKVTNSVLSVEKSNINETVEAMHEDIYGKLISDTDRTETVPDVSGMEAKPMMMAVMEEAVTDKAVMGNAVTENIVTESNSTQNKLTYEMYCQMIPEEKAKAAGFTGMRSFDTVVNVVRAMFYEMGHKAGIDEIMEKYVTELRVAEILKDMSQMEVSYSHLTDKEKAKLFDFQVENNDYNLKLYLAVMKAVGIRQSMDEMYEDYQRIYDKTVEKQMEKEVDKRDEERGRGR